jgi:hypothetical protein
MSHEMCFAKRRTWPHRFVQVARHLSKGDMLEGTTVLAWVLMILRSSQQRVMTRYRVIIEGFKLAHTFRQVVCCVDRSRDACEVEEEMVGDASPAGQVIPTFWCLTTENELMKSELALLSIFSIDMAFASIVLWSTDW